MTPQDFFDRIAADRNLYGFDVDTEGKRAIVGIRDAPPGKDKAAISFDDIGANIWPSIRDALLGRNALYTVTRVCGYFARTENFNKSKLGELFDRRAATKHYASMAGRALDRPTGVKGAIQ